MRVANLSSRQIQCGAAVVEFALVAAFFFTLLIGIMEMGRILFYWNTAAEVTRLGARMAVVCSQADADGIKSKMVALLPTLAVGDIDINYQPAGCTSASCEWITASIAPSTPIDTFIPFVPLSLTMPAFSTTLSRESMDSSGPNPVCP